MTTGPTAQPGSARFTVTSVASAASVVSSGTVGSLTSPVATGPFQITKGAAAIGLSAVTPGATLSAGTHTITVTQASAAATLTGSSALAPTVDHRWLGQHARLLPSTTAARVHRSHAGARAAYTPDELAAEIGRASGGKLAGSIDDGGHLQVSTAREGSTVTLTVDPGNTTLGLASTRRRPSGTDGIVQLDGVAQRRPSRASARETRSP